MSEPQQELEDLEQMLDNALAELERDGICESTVIDGERHYRLTAKGQVLVGGLVGSYRPAPVESDLVTIEDDDRPEIYTRIDAEKNSRSVKVGTAYSVKSRLPLDQHMALVHDVAAKMTDLEHQERTRLEGETA